MSNSTDSSSGDSSGERSSLTDHASTSSQQGGVRKTDQNRDDVPSKFAPTDQIERPEVALEDVYGDIPTCSGRGQDTAAVRGYNAERLANAVFSTLTKFHTYSDDPWYDTFAVGSEDVNTYIESKSCVYRYPSGPYGRFRIWKPYHEKFVSTARSWYSDDPFLYFFCVYTVKHGVEREVGKLVVSAERVDEVLNSWSVRDHPTMGDQKARDISWHQLLKRLGVPKTAFTEQPIIDLTEGRPTDD